METDGERRTDTQVITSLAQEATVCLTQIAPSASFPNPPSPIRNAISSIFDYRLLAVISAQFHFTIWQLCYLCHWDLSGRSISSTGNLHVCISLGPFVKATAKHLGSGRGGNFSAQISFHLWYPCVSLRVLNLKHSDTKARPWICNPFIHSVTLTCAYLHPLWHHLKHAWQQNTWAEAKMETERNGNLFSF